MRLTPASRPAFRTLRVPSRAGTMTSSSFSGFGGREWGRDVKHVLGAVDGFGPAGVGGQISAREGEPITGVGPAGGDHVADFALEDSDLTVARTQ